MSRSRKHFPISQWACGNDGLFKRDDLRRHRRALNRIIEQVRSGKLDYDEIVLPPLRQYSDPYNWPSDGGKYYSAFHRCTTKCEMDDFEKKWCAYRRKWDKERMRK